MCVESALGQPRPPHDGEIAQRVARTATLDEEVASDVTIQNVGRPGAGVRRLLNTLRDPGLFVVY
jgi:ribose 1,5-bisphosphokinase PhnN